jgi:hypothetical protein
LYSNYNKCLVQIFLMNDNGREVMIDLYKALSCKEVCVETMFFESANLDVDENSQLDELGNIFSVISDSHIKISELNDKIAKSTETAKNITYTVEKTYIEKSIMHILDNYIFSDSAFDYLERALYRKYKYLDGNLGNSCKEVCELRLFVSTIHDRQKLFTEWIAQPLPNNSYNVCKEPFNN